MGKTIKFSIVGIILLALAALALFNNQNKITKDEGSVINKEDYISNNIASIKQFSLPEFSSTDIFGKTVNTSLIKGKKAFIQFIDPKSENQIEALKKFYQEYKDEEITITIYVKDSESHIFDRFMDEIRFALGDIFIITENYEAHKKIFRSPSCCETFYLFDQSGNFVLADLNWKLLINSTKTLQEKLISNKKSSVLDFINPGENIKDLQGFKHIYEITEKEREYDYFIISMFTNICMGCPSGWIVNELKKLHELFGHSMYFLIILSDDFNENDIDNLKTILKIKLPVIKADEILLKKWNQLNTELGKSRPNNIVFLLNKKGQILIVMKPPQQKEFFNHLIRLKETIQN